jgi:hypothetical protein
MRKEIQMNAKPQKLVTLLALLLLFALTGCIGFGDPLESKDQKSIDQQIRESIEETFPLPDEVMIRTHVGDDLRFSTELSVDEILTFYRDAYTQRGYAEAKDSQVSADSASLLFKKEGEKEAALEVTKNENGCDVHIQLKSPAS